MCTTDCKYSLIEEAHEQRLLLTCAIEKAEQILKEYIENKNNYLKKDINKMQDKNAFKNLRKL